jgi:hypothetical protein
MRSAPGSRRNALALPKPLLPEHAGPLLSRCRRRCAKHELGPAWVRDTRVRPPNPCSQPPELLLTPHGCHVPATCAAR